MCACLCVWMSVWIWVHFFLYAHDWVNLDSCRLACVCLWKSCEFLWVSARLCEHWWMLCICMSAWTLMNALYVHVCVNLDSCRCVCVSVLILWISWCVHVCVNFKACFVCACLCGHCAIASPWYIPITYKHCVKLLSRLLPKFTNIRVCHAPLSSVSRLYWTDVTYERVRLKFNNLAYQ